MKTIKCKQKEMQRAQFKEKEDTDKFKVTAKVCVGGRAGIVKVISS